MSLFIDSHASLHAVIRRAHLRMAAMAISLAGVLLLVVGVVVLRFYLLNNLQLMARSLAYTVEASLVFNDHGEASRVLDQLLRNEDVARSQVFDAQGQVFVRWSSAKTSSGGAGELLAAVMGMRPAEAPVSQDGRQIGRVVLYSDGAGFIRFLSSGLAVLLLCVGISGFIGMRLSRRMLADIAEPLQQLARVARAVRHDRSMGQRVPPARIAELHELGDDFNALLSELQMRQERLRQQNSQLELQASRDGLTGLANRSHFEQRLQQALLDAEAMGRKLAVLFIDNDHFKQVNDIHGHAAGDALLRAVGLRLHSVVREADLVARLGGDEFAILLYPVGGMADAQVVEHKIQEAMQCPVVTSSGAALRPSVSVGIAVFPLHGQDMEKLMDHADQAMYEAKVVRHAGSAANKE